MRSSDWSSDVCSSDLKLCLLYIAATTVAYSEWITTPLFHGMPDAISPALAGKTIGTAGQAFDDYYAESDVIIVRIETEAATYSDINPYNLVLYALSLGLKAIAGLSAAIGFAVTIFCHVALANIITLGPFFLASTRN